MAIVQQYLDSQLSFYLFDDQKDQTAFLTPTQQ